MAKAIAAALSAQLSWNKYAINVKQISKFVKENMRVGVDRPKYCIQIPLSPKLDPTVSLVTL
jgi:26S proteasome regulatory subunit T1